MPLKEEDLGGQESECEHENVREEEEERGHTGPFVAPEVKVKGEPHGPEKFSELFPLTKRKRKSVAKKVSPATDARRGGDPLTVSEDWPTRQRRACALF